ncbi:cation:proton antiporter [Plantactinospora sp. ZYX-F-223]|uniref:cation:proton antiporter n=1 Tax=Plantactinospora sp. ZYX-F-223 TaxID=3144103 RepID=UPI0031FE2F60
MSAHALINFLLAVAAIIVLARAFGWLARLVGQPPVIGELVAGVLIGPTLFGTAVSDWLLPADVRPAMSGLANLGLVLFMFIVGYELDHASLRGRGRTATSVSIGSILAPLGLGVLLAMWLAGRHEVSAPLPFALFIGAAMAVTAFPVLARILTDRGMVRTPVGGLALASAAVDDVAAWSLLAVVVAVAGADSANPWLPLLCVPYTLLMLLVVRPLLARVDAARARAGRLTPDILAVVLVGLLLSSLATEWLGLHAIFGAFLFGAVMPRARAGAAEPSGADRLRVEILERLEQVSVLLLLPAFFVLSGLRVDLSTFGGTGLLELAAILVVAIGGKFAGAYAAARLNKVAARPAGALAILMNTRGLTEIVILTVGLELGIIDERVFSMMVVMALVTTVMAGPLLSFVYPRWMVERDALAVQRPEPPPAGYRVLVSLPGGLAPAPALVDLAADFAERGAAAAGHGIGEVVLSRLVPYPARPLDVGSGLSEELLGMTTAMGELAGLAESVRARGLGAPVLARFSRDPEADLAAQLAAVEPDVLLRGGEPAVVVPLGSGAEAVRRDAAELAAARGFDIVIQCGGPAEPRTSGVTSG